MTWPLQLPATIVGAVICAWRGHLPMLAQGRWYCFRCLRDLSTVKGWHAVGLIELIVILVIVGLLLYVVETYVPISPPIKTIIRVFVVLVVILWLVRLFVGDIPIGRVR